MYFTVEKIEKHLGEIRGAIYREAYPIPSFKIHAGDCPEAARVDYDDRSWPVFSVGDTWGGYDVVAWFRTCISIPDHLRSRKLALRFQGGPRDGGVSTAEALLYVNGSPLQGIDVWHEEACLPPEAAQAESIQITIKAWSGVLGVPDRRCFKLAELDWIDEPTERFYHLAVNLLKSIKILDENDLRRIRLIEALNSAYLLIDFIKPRSEGYYRSIAAALDELTSRLSALEAVEELKPSVTGIGHAHIDMAWLWRLRHTREKASRTFSTALNLMRQYPEYRFMHSSPQLYKFLKEDYPEIYARVKEKILAGEWEVTGGMWVEADTNLTSGESLIRQFLLGRRWIREEFGVEMKTLWLPDVFGYTGSLPQIVRRCGLNYFLTTKISWSQYNRFPYDTFYWRGIDGTELLTHFVTTPDGGSHSYTYNGQLSPAEVKGIWANYRQKDVNDELILLYGWGDGGGGPTKEMLESARALKNIPGMPKVKLDKAEPYFARLEERVAGKKVPVWDGELYLEYHRGTYTSQAAIKRFNRSSEILYHNAEWLCALVDVLDSQKNYPQDKLRTGWERILLNQFHDILPGSSIRQVYEDAREDYKIIREIGEKACDLAEKRIGEQISVDQESWLILNPLSWRRTGLVEIPWSEEMEGKTLRDGNGLPSRAQVSEVDSERKILLEVNDVPALGYQALPVIEKERSVFADTVYETGGTAVQPFDLYLENSLDIHPIPLKGRETLPPEDALAWFRQPRFKPSGSDADDDVVVRPDMLENRFYRIRLNDRGQLISIWDKRNRREVLAEGMPGNVFQAFEDKPMNFDAWDIDLYYQEKCREIDDLVEVTAIESGPLRGTLRLQWRFFDSTITQDLSLYQHTPRIDFRTRVDWHEHQVLLKTAFPVAVRSTRATYEIQFGSVERPTHWNTSWDYARFEVPGHKWVDLSEGNYGVALLNDCKYGHDIKDNVMRLTLIKSAINPDKTADQGEHIFTYSLLPHTGDWRTGGVVEEAYALNNPLLVMPVLPGNDGNLPLRYEFVRLDADHVILETVKKAEEDDAWIVRLYESKQYRSSNVHLEFGSMVRKVVECNMVEEDEHPVEHDDHRVTFAIAPFEVKTFKMWFV